MDWLCNLQCSFRSGGRHSLVSLVLLVLERVELGRSWQDPLLDIGMTGNAKMAKKAVCAAIFLPAPRTGHITRLKVGLSPKS